MIRLWIGIIIWNNNRMAGTIKNNSIPAGGAKAQINVCSCLTRTPGWGICDWCYSLVTNKQPDDTLMKHWLVLDLRRAEFFHLLMTKLWSIFRHSELFNQRWLTTYRKSLINRLFLLHLTKDDSGFDASLTNPLGVLVTISVGTRHKLSATFFAFSSGTPWCTSRSPFMSEQVVLVSMPLTV